MAKATRSRLTEAALAELGPAKLAALVLEEAQANPVFRKRVTAALASMQGPEAVAKLVERRLSSLEKARSSIDWPKIKEFEKDLAATLATILDEIGPVAPSLAFDLLLRFLADASGVFQRVLASSNHLDDLYAQAATNLGPLAERQAPAERANLPERVLAAANDGDSLASRMIGSMLEHASAAELETWDGLLARKVASVADAYRAYPYRQLRQDIATRRDDLDGWIALERQKSDRVRDPLAIAEKLIAAGRAAEALPWLDSDNASPVGFTDALDIADGVSRRDPRLRARVGLRARALETLGRKQEAQDLRWATFKTTLDPTVLRDYIAKLDDFAEFDALDKAFAHAVSARARYRALAFLTEWPRLDHAAALVIGSHRAWDGRHFGVLQPAADRLREAQPLAASLLYRAMVEVILARGQSEAYGLGVGYLARLDQLAPQLEAGAMAKLGRLTHADWRSAIRRSYGRKFGFWAAVGKASS